MNYIPIIGSISLGIVIGWLVRFFIRRFKTFTPKALGTVVSVVAGGAAVRFLETDQAVWWFYPIGLFIGFIIYTIMAVLAGADREGVLYYKLLPPEEIDKDAGKILRDFTKKHNDLLIKDLPLSEGTLNDKDDE